MYTLIFIVALPFIMVRLWWKGGKTPGYRQRWMQRLGFFPATVDEPSLWVHAVSVGEVRAATPLIEALLTQYKGMSVVVTTTTPTGYEQVVRQFGSKVRAGHLPYDIPGILNIFLRRVNPAIGIIMERELWPNLFHACRKRRIPLILANARLPERSLEKYLIFSKVVTDMVHCLHTIAAVSDEDAARFIRMGMDSNRTVVTGNLKANALSPVEQKTSELEWIGALVRDKQPIWLAASTHAGEEAIVLEAHKKIASIFPESLLILVPRHPERTPQVVQQCQKAGLSVSLHSSGAKAARSTRVYLVDTLGDLMLFYNSAEVTFVGGSLVPIGGHNVLEPIICRSSVIFGPYVWNFDDICRTLLDEGGASKVNSALEIAQCVEHLFQQQDKRQQQIASAHRVLEKHRQSLPIHMDIIAGIVKQPLQANSD